MFGNRILSLHVAPWTTHSHGYCIQHRFSTLWPQHCTHSSWERQLGIWRWMRYWRVPFLSHVNFTISIHLHRYSLLMTLFHRRYDPNISWRCLIPSINISINISINVTSWNSDTILCIFSLDLCLPLYLVMDISMIYDYLYICLLMFTPLPIYLLQTLSFTAFQVIGK